jgi:hypothetical protein
VTFSSTVDTLAAVTPVNLAVKASGPTRFSGAVGKVGPFASLSTAVDTRQPAGTTFIDGGFVATVGDAGQDYSDKIELGADTSLTSGPKGAIVFNDTLDGAAKALAECFLFCDEAPLAGPIEGTTTFATDFAARGPTDGAGRSLRQLDLERRLFRHPCSFLVYSPSFDALPAELRARFWARIDAVLKASDPGPRFAHLSADDRRAIRAILVATKPDAVAHWPAAD